MKRNIWIILFIVLSFSSIYAIEKQGKGDVVVEQEMTAGLMLEEADSVFQARDYKSALELYHKVSIKAKEEFNPSVDAEAMSQMARMNLILGNKDEGQVFLEEAGSIARESDPYGWSRYLGVKGRFEWQNSDLVKSRQTFDQMYNYCVVNSLWGRAVDAAHMIAIVADNFEDQLEWSMKGIEAAEANDQEKWLGPLWNNLAGTYYDKKQYDSALSCYIKAREYHWRFSGETGKLFADYHVGMTYRLLGNYEEAGKWLRPVLAWAERLNNNSAIGQACEDLGEAMIGLGEKEEGLKLLKQARDAYQKEGFDKSWKDIWDNINKRISEVG